MSRDPFQSFVDLIAYDQTNLTQKQHHERLMDQLSLLEKNKQALSAEQQTAHQRFLDAKKKVAQAESRMHEYQSQEQQLKQKLESVSSHKQYASIQAELKVVQQKQHDHEEALLAAWHEAEVAQRQETQAQESFQKKVEELDRLMLETNAQVQLLEQEIDLKKQERSHLLVDIPQEWLDIYEQLREKIAHPIVPVEGNACSYCYYMLPEPQLAALRRKALLQCKGCFRFLYVPSVHREMQQ